MRDTACDAKILQFKGRNMVFRKCSTCGSKITFAVYNEFAQQDERFYCEKCKKIVTELTSNFRLDMTYLNIYENKIESVVAYDAVAENFMGCSANDFILASRKDSKLIEKLENLIEGMFCRITTIPNKKNESSKKASKINLAYPEKDAKIMDILNSNCNRNALVYDSSLM